MPHFIGFLGVAIFLGLASFVSQTAAWIFFAFYILGCVIYLVVSIVRIRRKYRS